MRKIKTTALALALMFFAAIAVQPATAQETEGSAAKEQKKEEKVKEPKKEKKVKEPKKEKEKAVMSTTLSSGNNPQIQNKKGVDMMPVANEFAIGMSANPFFQYVGNLFGYTANNTALNQNKFLQNSQLFGKYMLTDNTALRVRFRGYSFTDYNTNEVYDDLSNVPEALVEDKLTTSSGGVDVGAGYEWRRGKSRFRVIYGAEATYSYNKGFRQTYSYGNDFSNSNIAPTSTVVWNTSTSNNGAPDAERLVSRKGNAFNRFGLRGFAGVEYFLIPKLCIGTEFGWGANYTARGELVDVYERYETLRSEITQREVKAKGINELNIDTDNLSGTLYLLFYF